MRGRKIESLREEKANTETEKDRIKDVEGDRDWSERENQPES